MILEVSVDGRETIRLTIEPSKLPFVLENLATAVRLHGWRGTMEIMEKNGCKVSAEPLSAAEPSLVGPQTFDEFVKLGYIDTHGNLTEKGRQARAAR